MLGRLAGWDRADMRLVLRLGWQLCCSRFLQPFEQKLLCALPVALIGAEDGNLVLLMVLRDAESICLLFDRP